MMNCAEYDCCLKLRCLRNDWDETDEFTRFLAREALYVSYKMARMLIVDVHVVMLCVKGFDVAYGCGKKF